LVDPLDGTTNYLHQFPSYCVSIGMVIERRVVVGVVVDPMLRQTYLASEQGGAWRNGQPIRCSGCQQLSRALVAASLPPELPNPSRNLGEFVQILRRAQSMRRLGSCALNLCYLADGRLDAYWADTVRAWDVAAGALIAKEAGAHLVHRNGAAFEIADPRFIAAASSQLAEELRDQLDRAVPI
jgi:myo-inositol-1(or 4)-monophosphatase